MPKSIARALPCCLLLACAAVPQEPRPAQPGSEQQPSRASDDPFDTLVQAVDAAHRGKKRDAKLDRFTGELTILPVEPEAEQQTEVKLHATFLAPNLLRYEILEAGQRLERGIDGRGAWMRKGDEILALGGKDYATDRETIQKHVRLARQLVEFLDPGATMRALAERSAVTTEELAIGRRTFGSCQRVDGVLANYPLYQSSGEGAKVRLELYTRDGLLVAVRATPLDEEGQPTQHAEVVVIEEYGEFDDVAIPASFTILGAGDVPRATVPLVRISIRQLDLAPELDAKSFDRPKPK